jgi:predicted CXXCH cytochrome family protein
MLSSLIWLTPGAQTANGQQGRILRPVDGAALPAGEIDIIATAPAGKVELDGKPVAAEEPFENVFHSKVAAEPGVHTLAVVWEGGRAEIRIFVGENPPAEFAPFHPHPPVAGVECTQCHGLSRRGRFRFQGGCFDCHREASFTDAHPHPPHMLQECGLCHNAHGSTVAKLLIHPREIACKLCHN